VTSRRRRVLLAGIAATALALGGVLGSAAADGGRGARTAGGAAQARAAISVDRAVGQMIVTGFAGRTASMTLLARIRDGHVGGVILFAGNTAGGQAQTLRLVRSLQAAAAQGHQPGLLVMTDQEGGSVRRLPGPPELAASQMTSAAVAGREGRATGRYLAGAGVNVDLAPVADVRRNKSGFLAVEHRTFGSTPAEVASRACAFAGGVGSSGVVATFKHFPGLGRAIGNTDAGPVRIDASAGAIRDDEEAYRTCAGAVGSPTLVMVSSASYPRLTGDGLPAVLSPEIYRTELPVDAHVNGPTISDDLGAGALSGLGQVALRAVDAGLDLLLYGTNGSDVGHAYATLAAEARSGALPAGRLQAAASSILALKRRLGLPDA
jgi:beta-N-acetylhexosaminidase